LERKKNLGIVVFMGRIRWFSHVELEVLVCGKGVEVVRGIPPVI
jgi:hypothetical protein